MSGYLSLGIVLIGAYFLGSIPTGYLLTRWTTGVDVRSQGSGNVGATNVARVAGKTSGLIVLILDAAKGTCAVTVWPWWLAHALGAVAPTSWPLWCGLAVVVGHDWTCWLQFSGGKGIATSLGVLAGVAPVAALACMVIWAVVFAVSRIVSLSSVITALIAPLLLWLAHPSIAWLGFGLTLAIIAIIRHKSNIQRLLHGTEQKFNVS